jgi:DNA polymerase
VSDGLALARAYLEQQRILGGDPVVMTDEPTYGMLTPGASPGFTDTAHTSATPSTPATNSSTLGLRPGSVEASELPPPGISYDPPTRDLFTADPISQATALEGIAQLVAGCTKCRLCESRTRTVPGEGPSEARLVVIGEGPGRVEDETGRPFVGAAGELLTKILGAIALPREQVFICNVVKCRPPENRPPQYDEIAACLPYLHRQIEILKPTVILAMGNTAAQTLLNAKQSLGSMRNHVHRFRGIPVIVTYHPAALLRNPNWKRPTWDDVRIARRLLD